MQTIKETKEIRRNNAKLYPIYKMFSWDLLFFLLNRISILYNC